MSLPINPIAAILVANGQGEIAVSNPKRKAVSAGAVLLSNNVCNHSIELYFNKVRTFSATPFLKVAGAVLALAKAYSVRFSYVSLPAFHLLMKSEDHVTSYFSAIAFVLRFGNVDSSENECSVFQFVSKFCLYRFFGVLFYCHAGSASLFAMKIQHLHTVFLFLWLGLLHISRSTLLCPMLLQAVIRS